MRRAALEQARTLREWRKHRARHVRHLEELGALAPNWVPGVSADDLVDCACDNQAGRFRKSRWLTGGNQRCDPREFGIPTRQEARSEVSFQEWVAEVWDSGTCRVIPCLPHNPDWAVLTDAEKSRDYDWHPFDS